ncbi:ABC transporter permease [Mycoplasmopsis pullorum]|uniref:Peptide ABC transporter permease n=1 Tax=Mycoplasmopsis pullorum TaxID=48003 RepID=A0A1L4FRI8_9BACT|nr:ABC transporter permease [Mycoplasmopsis pullorum]APJ38223.1 peptide ABC transporter permease [Mycoplasmopsis pullorum]
MTKYIFQRVCFALLTLFVIIVVVYIMTAQFTENPFAKEAMNLGDKQSGGGKIDNERGYQLFRQSVTAHLTPNVNYADHAKDWFSLRVNIFVRLAYWFKDVFNKETPFGLPYNTTILSSVDVKTIPQFFFKYLKYSIIITLPSFIFSAFLGIILGIVAGYKRGSLFDAFINAFSLLFIALPSFVIAPFIISLFLKLGISPKFMNPDDDGNVMVFGWWAIIKSWLPPILILVLGSLSGYITFVRNQVITVLTSNYVLIAKTKGLGTVEIFLKYVLRNISIPLATALIPSYIGLLTGGVVIESYWEIPGTSKVLASSFPNGEVNLIMFNTVFFTFLGLMTTILVDVVYTILDPRIKYSSSSGTNWWQIYKSYSIREKTFKQLTVSQGGQA